MERSSEREGVNTRSLKHHVGESMERRNTGDSNIVYDWSGFCVSLTPVTTDGEKKKKKREGKKT